MKSKSRFILLTLLIVALFLVGGLYLDQNNRTTASDQPTTDISLGVEQSQKLVINLYYDTQEQLNAVAGQMDVWEVHPLPGNSPGSGYAVAAVVPSQRDWLQLQGYRVEVDQAKTAELQSPTAALDPRYFYFDSFNPNSNNLYMVNFMQDTSTNYPNLTELLDIGDAWLGMHGGYHRDEWVLRITNEDPQYGDIASKPPFFMMANTHAREVSTPEMAIRYIKYLTSGYLGEGGYGIDPDVTWLVNHHVVYVVVSENPDGRVINEIDWTEYWRKNVDNDDGCSSSFGVDLNRNSSFKWGCCGGSDPNPCGETYRGPSRASEPETTAIQTFAGQVFGDWNGPNGDDELPSAAPDNTPGIFISLHSYQDEILWAYECAPNCGQTPNSAQLSTIGHKLADETGEHMNPTGFLYTVDGGMIDFIYGKLGIAAYTYEIGPTNGTCGDFFPPYGCQDGIDGMPRNFWAEMGPSWVYANKIAGSPYKTAYGPDAQNLVVDPTTVPGGLPVNLSATILDQRYPGEPLTNIAAAEFFIDAPGMDGTGIAMSPVDGAWDETNEAVSVVVDTTGLLEGKHYILVHGMNANGFWGPFTAIFLDVTTPSYGVMLTPTSAAAQDNPGTTVTYHLEITNIGQNSDSYDISVASGWAVVAPLTIGPIAPAGTESFDVQVTIPPDAINGEIDTAIVTAASQFDPEINAVSNLTTTANFYSLTLTPPTNDGAGSPGEQVAYVLHLTNSGNVSDTYDLASASLWTVTLPASVGPIEPGASTDINLLVDVPAGAVPGDLDTATITATSQGNSAAAASSTLTTSVTTLYSFEVAAIEPVLVAHGRGVELQFSVQVTNTGNIADTYSIHVVDVGWPADGPAEVGPVNVGESATFTITVHVPLDIVMGASNTTTINVLSSNGTGHVVTLRTETEWYNIFLPLSQNQ
jgi:carboxypeptidase T